MKAPNVKFPEPKPIDWTKYIEPKNVILVTKNGLTTALLIPRPEPIKKY
jgi:hypothetical protein